MPYDSLLNTVLLRSAAMGIILTPLVSIAHVIASKYHPPIAKPKWSCVVLAHAGYLLFILCWTFSPLNEMVLWYLD